MDSVLEYKNDLPYWAAGCAMEGIQMMDELPTPDQAAGFIDEVWEFVVETCLDNEIHVPNKDDAISELKEMIASYLVDMTE